MVQPARSTVVFDGFEISTVSASKSIAVMQHGPPLKRLEEEGEWPFRIYEASLARGSSMLFEK